MTELNLTIGQSLALIIVLFIFLAIELHRFYHSTTTIEQPAPTPQEEPLLAYLERYGAYIQMAGRYYN